MQDRIFKKSKIIDLVEAQGKTTDSISQRLVNLEELINKQESRNDNVIYAVLIASILIVGSVAIEVIISNKNDMQFYAGLEKSIHEQNLKVQDFNNKIDNLKIRNPYLK